MKMLWVVSLAVAATACSSGPGPDLQDSGSMPDAGAQDSGVPDAGAPDAGTADAGPGDAGADTDTWTNWASADFFAVYCVSCHTPGASGDPSGAHLDFTTYADVATNAAAIRCGTSVAHDPSWSCGASPAAKQFPIGSGPKPTDDERNRLVAWIDAGYPQ